MTPRDGHVRVLPLHVANKIAAGEVVERPASVVKELVENALDAGASQITVTVTQGGRKLVAVRDDGCGMTRDDAVLSLERQATSKILDVGDIEEIDTLGFRGEAIPSIASVSRFTLTTRRADSDEGTRIQVNAGILAEVAAAGCPPGTLVEVRDLFCNVPARRKFLRAYATEEAHVRSVFTVHALAHPSVGFALAVDGREVYRLAPAATAEERVRDLFGAAFFASLLALPPAEATARVRVTGYVERPNLAAPTRREQYVFVNGRPATAACIAYAMREAFPRRPGDVRPAAVVFIDLPPDQVDVNVHPTKREVRFRDNVAVKQALGAAVASALRGGVSAVGPHVDPLPRPAPIPAPQPVSPQPSTATLPPSTSTFHPQPSTSNLQPSTSNLQPQPDPPAAVPTPQELPLAATEDTARPWQWFKFLAVTASGYVLVETDAGVVTVNPHAARERIAYERLLAGTGVSQPLLIPEVVRLSPPDFARLAASRAAVEEMGFRLEEFGTDTFKVEAVPQLIGEISPATILMTMARDLADGGSRRAGARWREELLAKSVAKSFAGMSLALDEKGAVRLVEELAACRMPYVCPRGKPIMIFTSTRELNRKFARD